MGLMIFLGGSALSVPGPRGAAVPRGAGFHVVRGSRLRGIWGWLRFLWGWGVVVGGGVNCWGAGRWAIILWGLGTFLMFPNYLRS